MDRERPRRVDPRAERGQDADTPIAELVTEPLDGDFAIRRERIGKGIMAAKRKELAEKTPADLGFAELPVRRVIDLGLATRPPRELARMLEGSVEDMVVELVRILRHEEKAL